MQWMSENGLTVYLSAAAAELYHRLLSERESRPLLSALSDVALLEFIMGALSKREKFYLKAGVKLNARTATVSKALTAIRQLRKNNKPERKK